MYDNLITSITVIVEARGYNFWRTIAGIYWQDRSFESDAHVELQCLFGDPANNLLGVLISVCGAAGEESRIVFFQRPQHKKDDRDSGKMGSLHPNEKYLLEIWKKVHNFRDCITLQSTVNKYVKNDFRPFHNSGLTILYSIPSGSPLVQAVKAWDDNDRFQEIMYEFPIDS